MSISLEQAAQYLDLSNSFISPEIAKKSYRKLSAKFHPDRNPDGLEKMKMVNIAYDLLRDFCGFVSEPIFVRPSPPPPPPFDWNKYFDKELGIGWSNHIYINHLSEWDMIWVKGKTFGYKEELKRMGFRWNPVEKGWWKSN